MKVELKDDSGNVLGRDISDEFFIIEGPAEITSPNGGETLSGGATTWPIEWTTDIAVEALVTKVKLYYTKDVGTTWNPICDPLTGKCALQGNPRSYNWDVPIVGEDKAECKVKVELRDDSGNILGSDTSNGYFIIKKL